MELVKLLEPIYGMHLGPAMRARMLVNNLFALRALTEDRDDISDVLATMSMPCLLFGGTIDPRFQRIRQCLDRLPNAEYFSVPDCGHLAAWARSDLTLPHVQKFLRERS